MTDPRTFFRRMPRQVRRPPFLNILARVRGASPPRAVTLEFIEQ